MCCLKRDAKLQKNIDILTEKLEHVKHLYLMPGMAASPAIFEYLNFPYPIKVHFLSWILPNKKESLAHYAERMCSFIKHPDPILLGVSFGGLVVQEMAKIVNAEKVVIVSSIKSNKEMPSHMRMAHQTNVHKLLPVQWMKSFDSLATFAFGKGIQKRVDLYKKYLSVRDPDYLRWAINTLVHWDQETPQQDIVHIQGNKDMVFPVKNLQEPFHCIEGGHAMIINKARWFNKNLPELLL